MGSIPMQESLLHTSADVSADHCPRRQCRGFVLSTDLACPRCMALTISINPIKMGIVWIFGLLALVGATLGRAAWPMYLFLSFLVWELWRHLVSRSLPASMLIPYAALTLTVLLSMGIAFSLTGLFAVRPWPPADVHLDLFVAMSFVVAGLLVTILDVTNPRWPMLVYDGLLGGGLISASLAFILLLSVGSGSKGTSLLWIITPMGFGLVAFQTIVEGIRRGFDGQVIHSHPLRRLMGFVGCLLRGLFLKSPIVLWKIVLSALDIAVRFLLPMVAFIAMADLNRTLAMAMVRFIHEPTLGGLGLILLFVPGLYVVLTLGLLGIFQRLEVWASLTLGLVRLVGPALLWTALYGWAMVVILRLSGRMESYGLFLGWALLSTVGWLMLPGIGLAQEIRMQFLKAYRKSHAVMGGRGRRDG